MRWGTFPLPWHHILSSSHFPFSTFLISSLILNTSTSSYPFPSIVPRPLSSILYPAFPLTQSRYSAFSLFFRFFLCFSWILSCFSSYFSFSSNSSFSSSSSYSPFTFCTFFFLSTLFLPPVLKILFTSLFFSPLFTHSCILLFLLLQFFICSTSFIYYFSLSPILPFLISPQYHAPQSPNVFLSFFIYFPSLISKYISQFQLSETECD